MYGIIFTECSAIAAVTLVTFSLGVNGASTVTNLQNAQDLAPNFAGSIYGIINCIGGIANLLAPLLTSIVTAQRVKNKPLTIIRCKHFFLNLFTERAL